MITNNFYPEFFWQAAQAVEKYLKAGLLLQGYKLSKGTHKLEDLYKLHCSTYKDLAFIKFKKPNIFPDIYWEDTPVRNYIKSLNMNGHPDGRYGLRGWYRKTDDLFKLDQACWNFRRLSIGLDWKIPATRSTKSRSDQQSKTYKQALLQNPKFDPLGPIKKINESIYNFGASRKDILQKWNFEHYSSDDINAPAPRSLFSKYFMMSNSYLYLFWDYLIKIPVDKKLRSDKCDIYIDGMHWLIGNIKISPDAYKAIKNKLNELS